MQIDALSLRAPHGADSGLCAGPRPFYMLILSVLQVFQTRSWQGREAGSCLATFAQLGYTQKGAVSALAFSRDGRFLYSGASDGTLAAWRLNWVDPAPAGSSAGFRRGFF